MRRKDGWGRGSEGPSWLFGVISYLHLESREKFLVLYRLGNSIAVEQNGKSEEVFHASTQSSQQELKSYGLERCPGQVKAFAMQI